MKGGKKAIFNSSSNLNFASLLKAERKIPILRCIKLLEVFTSILSCPLLFLPLTGTDDRCRQLGCLDVLVGYALISPSLIAGTMQARF